MDVVVQAETAVIGVRPLPIMGVLTLGSAQDAHDLPVSAWTATIELVQLGTLARGPNWISPKIIVSALPSVAPSRG